MSREFLTLILKGKKFKALTLVYGVGLFLVIPPLRLLPGAPPPPLPPLPRPPLPLLFWILLSLTISSKDISTLSFAAILLRSKMVNCLVLKVTRWLIMGCWSRASIPCYLYQSAGKLKSLCDLCGEVAARAALSVLFAAVRIPKKERKPAIRRAMEFELFVKGATSCNNTVFH